MRIAKTLYVCLVAAAAVANADEGGAPNDVLPPTTQGVIRSFDNAGEAPSGGNSELGLTPNPFPPAPPEPPIGGTSPLPPTESPQRGAQKSRMNSESLTPMPVPPETEIGAMSPVPAIPPGSRTALPPVTDAELFADHSDSEMASDTTGFNSSQPVFEPWSMNTSNGRSCSNAYRGCLSDELSRMITGYVGATFMTRSEADRKLLFVNAARPNERIDAADFDFGVQSGVEAGIIAHGEVADIDIRFLNVGDISDTRRQPFTGTGAPIITPTGASIPGSRFGTVNYASAMNSFEANLRYRYGGGSRWWTLLAGFRYLNVNETLSGRFSAPGGSAVDAAVVDVDNHLFGLQIGADKTLFGDCSYDLSCYGRIGVYGNDSSTGIRLRNSTPGAPSFSTNGGGGQTSFAAEFGVKATYRLADAWNFYGRYQVLFVEDVALASHQVNNRHSAQGELTYHGAVFGLEYVY